MNYVRLFLAIAILTCLGNRFASAQDDPLLSLFSKMPSTANAVLAGDLDSIRQSDVVMKQRWMESQQGKVNSGFAFLPSGSERIVLATNLDYQTFERNWTSGLIGMSRVPDLDLVRELTEGQMDQLGGQPLVVTKSDHYVFKAGDDLATWSPANRQAFAPWLTSLQQSRGPAADSWLATAIRGRGDAQLVAAFDLNHLVSWMRVLQRAKEAQTLQSNGIDPEAFAKAVASVRGVTVLVNFTDAVNAEVHIDFGQNVDLLEPVARPLLTEVLEHHGMHVGDLERWDVRTAGNRIRLAGQLSTTALRRMLSLFDFPEPQTTAASGQGDAQPSAGQLTRNYFDALSTLLDDLQKEIGVGGESSYRLARWFRSYANQIDNLPIDSVDPDLLDFGAQVSRAFRDIATQMTSTRESVDVQNSNLMAYGAGSPAYRYRRFGQGYRGYGYGYAYPWGYGGYWRDRSGAQAANRAEVREQRRNIQVKARADASEFVMSTMNDVLGGLQDAKTTMTERYPDAF
jgi:hypothetical protein